MCLPNHCKAIVDEAAVTCRNRTIGDERLREQQPIEWVTVM
jgi:hypothetical protein